MVLPPIYLSVTPTKKLIKSDGWKPELRPLNRCKYLTFSLYLDDNLENTKKPLHEGAAFGDISYIYPLILAARIIVPRGSSPIASGSSVMATVS